MRMIPAIALVPLSGQPTMWDPQVTKSGSNQPNVAAIAVSATGMYIGGDFRSAGTSFHPNFARFHFTTRPPLPPPQVESIVPDTGAIVNGMLHNAAIAGDNLYDVIAVKLIKDGSPDIIAGEPARHAGPAGNVFCSHDPGSRQPFGTPEPAITQIRILPAVLQGGSIQRYEALHGTPIIRFRTTRRTSSTKETACLINNLKQIVTI